MDKKMVTSFRNRIRKAKSTLSIMGDMLLQIEIDGMTPEQRQLLRAALLESKNPLSYPYLDEKVGAA